MYLSCHFEFKKIENYTSIGKEGILPPHTLPPRCLARRSPLSQKLFLKALMLLTNGCRIGDVIWRGPLRSQSFSLSRSVMRVLYIFSCSIFYTPCNQLDSNLENWKATVEVGLNLEFRSLTVQWQHVRNEHFNFTTQCRNILQVRRKTVKKSTEETMYEISAESPEFCGRYYKKRFSLFIFRTQCIWCLAFLRRHWSIASLFNTFAKEVMFYPAFVCLLVCLCGPRGGVAA